MVMAITTKSLSHTAARRNACSKGARMASLPGITVDCALRTLAADYASIKAFSEKLAELLTRGKAGQGDQRGRNGTYVRLWTDELGSPTQEITR